jgi:hypothetical protein
MGTSFHKIERAKEELTQLHREFSQLEKRMSSLHESMGRAIKELFGPDRQAYPALEEEVFAARVAEAVVSRLPIPSQVSATRKQYVREKEAAAFMGTSVATLRRWRMLGSNHGPAFTRIGRMVMYPMAELEDHMKAGLVLRRG